MTHFSNVIVDLPNLTVVYGYEHCLDSVLNITLKLVPKAESFILKGDTCLSSLKYVNRYRIIL